MSNPTASISNLITARSCPVSKMPAKRSLLGTDGVEAYGFDNYRPRKLVAWRDYPKNCGRSNDKSPSSTGETKTEPNRDVVDEKGCPFTDGTGDVALNEPVSDVDCANAANTEAPIAAGPLRSVKSSNLSDTESSDGEIATTGVGNVEEEAFHSKLENMADVAKSQDLVSVLVEGGPRVDPMTLKEGPALSSIPDIPEGDENDEEICILSPEEWNKQKLFAKRTLDVVKVSIGKTDDEPANHNLVKTQENVSSDLMGAESGNTRHAQLMVDKRGTSDLEVCESPSKVEQDELLKKCTKDHNLAIVESSCKVEPISNPNWDLINLSIAEHDHPMAVKVRETLDLYDKYYVDFLRKSDNIKGKNYHMDATNRLKDEDKWVRPEKPFGHIPGIGIGDKFKFRCELVITGFHCQFVSGIDYIDLGGKKVATSVVHSGRYKNQGRTGDVLIYSGQGGYSKDQKLERGNLALVNVMEMGYPVRVSYKSKRLGSTASSVRKDNFEYIYDGLYNVKRYWEDIEENRKVLKFELLRLSDQARPEQAAESSRKLFSSREVCVLDDISDGKEKVKIPVFNRLDGDVPSTFAYMTDMVYPKQMEQIELIGCDCINGCSDLHQCHCVLKNGGEIPYNEEGHIVIPKPTVHECGPQCKCPPTCMNRVSQHGPKHQLEIFKTNLMGWGVRSRNNIPSGSFICEYVGELLKDNEADERSNDEYLFDIFNDDAKRDGFVIDAAVHGNIGRFINHHCFPNLFAQEVVYDHDDKRMPHIMFFASKNISALKELSYDYNYQIDKVCDKNGNIKTKYCKCGSRGCTGRMY